MREKEITEKSCFEYVATFSAKVTEKSTKEKNVLELEIKHFIWG